MQAVPVQGTEMENINTNDDPTNDPKLNRSWSVADDETKTNSKLSAISTVLLWMLVTYSVIISTYLLFATLNNSTETTCSCTTDDVASAFTELNMNIPTIAPSASTLSPSQMPTTFPSENPSFLPTENPSENPTKIPSKPPSAEPTNEPTLEPTSSQPTVATLNPSHAPTVTQWPIAGDFKLSFVSSTHDSWLLCDGTYYDSLNYTELFAVIGYSYGQSGALFRVPNIEGKTLGIAGGSHSIGSETGSETISLTTTHLPQHMHMLIADCDGAESYQGWAIATQDTSPTTSDLSYLLRGCDVEPTKWNTAWTGGGGAFSIMQPTAFVAKMFIHTGHV